MERRDGLPEQVVNLKGYAARFTSESAIIDELKEDVKLCVGDEDAERDRERDICVFPPSPEALGMMVSALVGATKPKRQVRDRSYNKRVTL